MSTVLQREAGTRRGRAVCRCLAAVVFLAVVAGGGRAVAAGADFSGHWRIVVARSSARSASPAGDVLLTVKQDRDSVVFHRSASGKRTMSVHRPGGPEECTRIDGNVVLHRSFWRGDTLVTLAREVREVLGTRVELPVEHRRYLSGDSLIVESTARGGGAEHRRRAVYVRIAL